MKTAAPLALLLLGLSAPTATAGEAVLGEHRFTLPDGFAVELVAGPPLVDRPITASFDEQGRLYVAESSGSNDPVKVQLEQKPHRILRLEDVDGDGFFDRRTIFADRMMFPEGTLWHEGSLYVSAPPQIWKLTDTDDDGVADEREVWFDGGTLTGCANDLHGPYAGPDGWIYWCKGAFAEQSHERADGDPFVTRAAHIFRRRADGTGPVEPVMTGGMDNPVDVVFTPGGERIFTCTFLQHPAGGHRDGLIHALVGGVYGKVHDVLNDHPWTRPEVLPPLVHLGPAAPAGLERYRGDAFGPEFRDNLFACQFNLRTVSRHVLTPDGSTFGATNEPFLLSDNVDFHPTDVLEDADGSLLVVDTGGWYKLCCPTSVLWKPDVLGGIYRVRRIGAPRVEDPRGLAIDWAGIDPMRLPFLLSDPRPAIRDRAVAAMAALGPRNGSVTVLQASPSVEARLGAVWAACRGAVEGSDREALLLALDDEDETVRQAALNALSLWAGHDDPVAFSFHVAGPEARLAQILRQGTPANRRLAAEVLGRIGDPAAVPLLLEAAGDGPDWALHHAITYALIELGDAEATRSGLAAGEDPTRRAALIALDQMSGDHLDASDVAPLLAADEPELREAAAWVASRHPEWGDALAGTFGERLRSIDAEGDDRSAIVDQLAKLAVSEAIRDVLIATVEDAEAPKPARLAALEALAGAGFDPAPAGVVAAVAPLLEAGGPLLDPAIRAVRSLRIPDDRAGPIREALLGLADDGRVPPSARLDALSALPGGVGAIDADIFTFLVDRLDLDRPATEQTRAADLLAAAALSADQMAGLARRLADAGPLALPRLLPAFDGAEAPDLGLLLVGSLEQASARSTIRPADLRERLAAFGPGVVERAGPLLAALDAGAEQTRARIEELLPRVAEGDVRRGLAVFNGEKAACRTCHAMGYVGGKVGPDLSKIGEVRTERDLLEAIVAPSASFVRSFEPVLVATVDGRVFNGILRDESAEHLTLTINADETVRLRRDEVEAMQPGDVSVMPAGLDQQLTPEELADLVAFLKSNK